MAKSIGSSWGVFHTLRSGGRDHRRLRLVVDEVPAGLRQAAVLEALEAAGYAARYSDGGVPWANHQLLAETRWPAVLEAAGRTERLTWSQLEAAGTERRITLRVSPQLHAAVTMAAGDESMATWATRVLERAARAELRRREAGPR